MRKVYYYLSVMILIPFIKVSAQDMSRNYVKTVIMLDNAGSSNITEIQYFDDLGRPNLFSTTGLGMTGTLVYTSKNYDSKGRVHDEYMPSLYQNGSGDRYTITRYDGLGRIVFTESPGQDWKDNDKGIEVSYATNSATEVKRYVAHVNSNSLTYSGNYAAGSLYVEKTTDEDGCYVSVYTDLSGRKVLERRNGNNDTYFVYDEKDQLRFVLSPEYQTTANQALYAYEYRYDAKGRMIWKQLPGCGYTQYWYDNNDRIQFTQDADLRTASRYRFTLYDALGRLAVQGICSGCTPTPSFTKVTYQSGSSGVCGTGYVISQTNLLTNPVLEKACYYDGYLFVTSVQVASGLSNRSQLQKTSPESALGLQTGIVYIASDGNLMEEVVYYDTHQRPIDTRRLYADGSLLTETTAYSFTDKPSLTVHTLKKGNVTRSFQTAYTYNTHNDQPIKTTMTSGGSTKTLIEMTYDNHGKLSTIKRGTSAGTVTYEYNERDWVSSITAGNFSEMLYYTDGTGTECYNGNISSMTWKVSNETVTRGYEFTYDMLNRLTEAYYGEGSNISTNTDRYTEKVLSYSANGAIKRMQRYGRKSNGTYGLTDDLTVTLNGNQLMAVSDAAGTQVYNGSFDFKDQSNSSTEYTYSNGGALLTDANKGIALMAYDNAGYPRRTQFTNANVTEFSYDADGRKWKSVHRTAVANLSVPIGSTLALDSTNTQFVDSTEYIGCFVRENGTVTKYLFDGGYCTFSSTGAPTLHYYTRDHLGNNREVISESGNVEQTTHYYPFGGVYGDIGTGSAVQKYKYNGKELDRTHGLDTYDYGFRMYDAALPMWDRPDLLAEKYYHISPYAYCANNPMNCIDINGDSIFIDYEYQDIILGFINSISQGVFGVSDKGYLYLKNSSKPMVDDAKYSTCYRDILIHGINSSNKISVSISREKLNFHKEEYSLQDYGEGLTISTKNQAWVYISGYSHDLKNGVPDGPELILAHELAGHAIPAISDFYVNPNYTGLAVMTENIIRKEAGFPERPWDNYAQNHMSVSNFINPLGKVLVRSVYQPKSIK